MRFIFPIILAVLGIAVLLWLGVWQRDRLDEKSAYLADINTRMVAEPVALPIEITPAIITCGCRWLGGWMGRKSMCYAGINCAVLAFGLSRP